MTTTTAKASTNASQEPEWSSRATLGLLVAALMVASLVLLGASSPAYASTTFTVDNTGDPGDGVCGIDCTLRDAILAANSSPNLGGPDLIRFNIPGTGVKTIKPTSELPDITEAVTINGYSQPGASPNTLERGTNAKLMVEIDGSNAGQFVNGLEVRGPNTVIRGLAINRFSTNGIEISFEDSKGVRVEGNFLGTDPSGTRDRGNFFAGVRMGFGASGNTIGGTAPQARNLISGNDHRGVDHFTGGGAPAHLMTNNKVFGNLIGTQKDGKSPLSNSKDGVEISDSFSDSAIDNTLVGGSTPASANIIAFNGEDGVQIAGDANSTGNRVLRNSIFSNKELGIDLGFDDSTKNDLHDADTGVNGLQNKPTIGSAVTSGDKTTLKGSLRSKPNQSYMVRFYSNPAGGDEGRTFIDQKKVTTNSDGKVSFTFSVTQKVGAGKTITATATGPEGTSEFSARKTVVAS